MAPDPGWQPFVLTLVGQILTTNLLAMKLLSELSSAVSLPGPPPSCSWATSASSPCSTSAAATTAKVPTGTPISIFDALFGSAATSPTSSTSTCTLPLDGTAGNDLHDIEPNTPLLASKHISDLHDSVADHMLHAPDNETKNASLNFADAARPQMHAMNDSASKIANPDVQTNCSLHAAESADDDEVSDGCPSFHSSDYGDPLEQDVDSIQWLEADAIDQRLADIALHFSELPVSSAVGAALLGVLTKEPSRMMHEQSQSNEGMNFLCKNIDQNSTS